ncbi:MarR family winged helix-turn-helix transcriptional regulator [Jiulongibacter sp. NS-SX5]|uniref:MarR family winged helix-turn-helix transcriptional regulator n=1 Tax=Jiulongibacter sp. NS-SX5 TaxID=3463854 RepID=UPI00405A39F5
MTLEKDIQQTKPFKSQVEKAIVNVMYTNNWICDRQYKLLKTHGLTIQQYNVLRILKGQYPNPLTINGIIERMLDKMSNASRLVDKLLQKGYVARTYRADDRRACDVTITEEGLKFVTFVNEEVRNLEADISKLNQEELDLLNNLLDKLRGSDEKA